MQSFDPIEDAQTKQKFDFIQVRLIESFKMWLNNLG